MPKNKNSIPDFIVPGFAKSGTSSLHDYLNQHPDIKMSIIKEPHNYSEIEYYEQRFNPTYKLSFPTIFGGSINNKTLLGESSTSYAICDYSAELIFQDNPNMKFIIIARDPIERIKSHYNWLLSFGKVENDFRTEIGAWVNKKFDIKNHVEVGYKYYTDISLYGKQLKNYLNYFDLKNFHFLSTENLKKNPEIEMQKCFNFLNIGDFKTVNSVNANQTKEQKMKYKFPSYILLFKNLIPQKIKFTLKKAFGEKYSIKNKYKPVKVLKSEDISWLKSLIIDDINQFKVLSKNKFEEWKHF